MFFAYKKILGRTETRTRDMIYCQTMRTVRYISRDDRARIATCSLRTLTDRRKANYSIDDPTAEINDIRELEYVACFVFSISTYPSIILIVWPICRRSTITLFIELNVFLCRHHCGVLEYIHACNHHTRNNHIKNP